MPVLLASAVLKTIGIILLMVLLVGVALGLLFGRK